VKTFFLQNLLISHIGLFETVAELDSLTRAKIVQMILDGKTENALEKLSEFYQVETPKITVGTIKRKRRTVYAVYLPTEKKIYALNSDILYNPFVILHEYYHHIRSRLGRHRGSERHANMYAKSFIDSYNKIMIHD
jgi:hypothetical protein